MIRESVLEAAGDDELVALVRSDDDEAFAELYRRHVEAARATARWLLNSSQDVDDIVSEAFAGTLSALRNGTGPRDNFRYYLLSCVRHGCGRRWRRGSSTPTDPTSMAEIPTVDEALAGIAEANTVSRAFGKLTPRWRQVLWLTGVEDRPVSEVAAIMHLSPSATSVAAGRARQAFASAYLSEHVGTTSAPGCQALAPHLGAYVRGHAGEIDTRRIDHHLESCGDCRVATEHLRDFNTCRRIFQWAGGTIGGGFESLGAGGGSIAGTAWPTLSAGSWWSSTLGAGLLKIALVALVAVPAFAGDSGHGEGARGGAHPARGPGAHVILGSAPASGSGAGGPTTGNGPTPPASADPGEPSGSADVGFGGGANDVDRTGPTSVSNTAGPADDPSPMVPSIPRNANTTVPASAWVTLPSVAGPVTTGPYITTAVVTTPVITSPAAKVGVVIVPPITLPVVSAPGVSVAPVTKPAITVPTATISPNGVPRVTVPSVTVPRVTVAPVTVPPITVPRVTEPPITVPPITTAATTVAPITTPAVPTVRPLG